MRLIYLIESCSLFVFEFVFVFVPVCLILKPTWLDAVVENTLVFVFVFVFFLFFLCVCRCVCLCIFPLCASVCLCLSFSFECLCVCLCLFDANITNLTSCPCCCRERSCSNQTALPGKKRHFSEIMFSKNNGEMYSSKSTMLLFFVSCVTDFCHFCWLHVS